MLLLGEAYASGPLACPTCRASTVAVNVSRWAEWIPWQVDRKKELRSRKQDPKHSDPEVNCTGLAGELAACLMLCPAQLLEWRKREEGGGRNRGCDLPREWIGLDRDVEVKEQPHQDEEKGLLIVRPRDAFQAEMTEGDVDDCYYVLLYRFPKPMRYRILGWIDRPGFLKVHEKRPPGWARAPQACWVVHWKQLWPINQLWERLAPQQARTADLSAGPVRSKAAQNM
jgi:hypothetical protein